METLFLLRKKYLFHPRSILANQRVELQHKRWMNFLYHGLEKNYVQYRKRSVSRILVKMQGCEEQCEISVDTELYRIAFLLHVSVLSFSFPFACLNNTIIN